MKKTYRVNVDTGWTPEPFAPAIPCGSTFVSEATPEVREGVRNGRLEELAAGDAAPTDAAAQAGERKARAKR